MSNWRNGLAGKAGRLFRIAAVLIGLLTLFPWDFSSVEAAAPSQVEILARLNSASVARRLENAFRVDVRDIGLSVLDIYGVDVPSGQVEATLKALQNSPWVSDVEPNYPVWALDVFPNDPAFPGQYALTVIRAPQGWAIEKGSFNIRIAIVDSGVDYHHPDLAGKLLPGFDFVNVDSDAQDDYGHGTVVAGVAAAVTDNSLGMTGVAWQAKIVPVKVLAENGIGTYGDVAAGIVWASYQGVQVINLSLGGYSSSFTLEDAVEFAASRGIILVAASGNDGNGNVLYPARYPQVIAVAATDPDNHWASFSNYGPDIDVAAPGVSIYSTVLGNSYGLHSGTSLAAPHVSGLAALLFSMPGQVTASQVRTAIETTALDVDAAGFDPRTGAGIVQMDAAMQSLLSLPALPPFPIPDFAPWLGDEPPWE